MRTLRARRVLRAERRGSSMPVLVETEGGVFFTKLYGAAQGRSALVAEIVVAELAEALGLRVPGRVLVELGPDVPSDERDAELADLLVWSRGLNLGFELLAGVRDAGPVDLERIAPKTASSIVWLDGLVLNPDRTRRNPNLLFSDGEPWLIDHGAALGFQHDWSAVTEDAPRRFYPPLREHVLLERAGALAEVDERLAGRLSREVLRAAIAAVPDDFLLPLLPAATPRALRRRREAYVAYLWKRLKPPRPFVPAVVPPG